MIQALPLVSQLLNQAVGKEVEPSTPATKSYLALSGVALSLVSASLWGVAVGCTNLGFALSNAYKVPLVVALSMLAALPPSLLSLRLSGAALGVRPFVNSVAHGMFAGMMWLGVLSPVIGLYFYTSSWAGPVLALGSLLAALIGAFRVLARSLNRSCDSPVDRTAVRMSGIVFCVLQLALMWQLIAIVSPIFPEGTVFSMGIDALRGH